MKQGLTDLGLDEPSALDVVNDRDAYAVAEHISIGEESSVLPEAPEQVGWRRVLAGPNQGQATEIVYFREGWLRLRTGSRDGVEAEQLVELGFLDAKFVAGWRLHKFWLWTSALCLACLPAIWLANAVWPAELSVGPMAILVIGAALGGSLALTMLARTARRSAMFVTRTGRVPAVRLTALPGRRAEVKDVAREVRAAIDQSMSAPLADSAGNLRAEMQGHYRLRDAGIISAESCAQGTRRILAQFG